MGKNKEAKNKSVTYEFDRKADFKLKFEEKYRKILGDENYERLVKYFLTFPKRSIRINTLKKSESYILKKLKESFSLTKIPWSEHGYWIEAKNERRDIGNTIEHFLGYIYIQEAVSMLPVCVLGNDLKKDGLVLDMCAAPGSKTTQLSQAMDNKGLIIANEIEGKRIASLGLNITRCGSTNVVITQHDATRLDRWIGKQEFDNIVVDAPCSGTGVVRKSLGTLQDWGPNLANSMARIQKRILSNAFALLKKNGVLTYSTCSIEPEEDEAVIDWFLKEYPDAELMDIDVDIKHGDPILEYDDEKFSDEIKKVLRIWPFDNDTDGFFVAKIRKKA